MIIRDNHILTSLSVSLSFFHLFSSHASKNKDTTVNRQHIVDRWENSITKEARAINASIKHSAAFQGLRSPSFTLFVVMTFKIMNQGFMNILAQHIRKTEHCRECFSSLLCSVLDILYHFHPRISSLLLILERDNVFALLDFKVSTIITSFIAKCNRTFSKRLQLLFGFFKLTLSKKLHYICWLLFIKAI